MRLDRYYGKLLTRFDERPALCFRDERLTYAEVDDHTARLANVFRSMGLREDRRVAILMRNRPEYLLTEIAVARAGAIAIPMNSRLDREHSTRIVTDAKADALVVGSQYFDVARELQQEHFELKYIVGVADDRELPVGFQRYDDLLRRGEPDPPTVDTKPDDVAAVFYTSGTTGPQKGVMHTHEALALNAAAHVHELDIRRHERVLLTTPLAHSANFITRAALAQGTTIVLHPGFDPERTLSAIRDHDVTWTFLVPTMLSRLLNDDALAETDVSSLETVVYGASSMPPALVERGIETFGQVFVQIYGLMEAPDVVTTLHKHKHQPREGAVLNTVGYPTQYADVRIDDNDDRWAENVGEIRVRSPFGMKGYYDQTSETPEWLRTGDLGRFDEAGRLVILDRIQDTIRVGDETVFSTRVENVVQRHPSVRQVAVIGVPAGREQSRLPPRSEYVDQEVKAVVATVEGGQLAVEGLREFCADHLAEHELPISVDFVGALPETPYGKVDKRSLRQPYW
ncbi:MAG: AMP-binding protein [Haloferacaceae archaeon]|jgi:fatty-acyl-CoA synthase/long-chain acyl-CoA synthetase